jgi:hypothetical protein
MYRTVFAYHPMTGEPAGTALAHPARSGGGHIMPPNTTRDEPPKPKRGFRVVFDTDAQAWTQRRRTK